MESQIMKVVAKNQLQLVREEVGPPRGQEVLVKTSKSLVSSGTERAFILELDNATGVYPFKTGYAASGTVEAVGDGVEGLRPGDRVTGFGLAHQDYGVLEEKMLAKLPDNLSDEEGAFGALGLICIQGVRKARMELGESCAVIGLGLIGQLALQLAGACGAFPVVGVEKSACRRELAAGLGGQVCEKAPAGFLADVAIECTGYPQAIQAALDVLRPGGRLVLLGSTRGECGINVYRDIHKKAVTIIGAHVYAVPETDCSPGRWTRRREMAVFLQLAAMGRVKLEGLVTHRCHHSGVVEFYRREILTWNDEVMGAVVDWNG